MRLPWSDEARLDRLAVRARGGDRDAFRDLYRALHPRVAGFAARRTARREDAEDAVSRTFHRLLERLDGYDAGRGTIVAFALAIARNLLLDDARARRASVPLEEAAAELVVQRTPLDGVLADERLRAARARLDAMPPEVRELFALRYGDGLSLREIAGLVGASEDAVKQRFSRALRALREPDGQEVLA